MPSILNTPAAKIPIHFFRLPNAQREILLVNVLTDPVLYEQILASALYHDDPVFPQAITLFCNYVLIRQMFACLTVPCLPVQIAEAFDPTLSAARSTMLIMLVDRGLHRLLGTLPRNHLANILCTVLLSLSEEQCRAYYSSDQVEEEVLQQPEGGIPQPRTADPRSPGPMRLSSPTDSLSSTDTAINPTPQLARRTNLFPRCSRAAPPLPQGNDIVATLHRLNKAGEGLADEVLLEWALDVLRSPEDWRWLWSPEPAATPSTFLTPLNHLPPLSYDASNANPWTMYAPISQSMFARSVNKSPPGTLSIHAQCTPAQSAESSVMWAPLSQPQLWHALHLSLPKWVTWDNLESESQGYEGGNVMVMEAPTSFSPFSPTDCILYSHFSFEDFVIIAFPDLTGDLDNPI